MSNPALIGAVLVSAALIGLVIYQPWLQMIFRTVPLTAKQLLRVIGHASIVPLVSSVLMLIPKRKKNDLELREAKQN